jgi:hypothetical protein
VTKRKGSRSRVNSNREVVRVRRQLDMKHQQRRDVADLKPQRGAHFEAEEADFGAEEASVWGHTDLVEVEGHN